MRSVGRGERMNPCSSAFPLPCDTRCHTHSGGLRTRWFQPSPADSKPASILQNRPELSRQPIGAASHDLRVATAVWSHGRKPRPTHSPHSSGRILTSTNDEEQHEADNPLGRVARSERAARLGRTLARHGTLRERRVLSANVCLCRLGVSLGSPAV